ncbi:MAG TPA: hypothetical protein VMU72_08935 [Gaiellaceae bacterium]|nr:hypothetical protein [Gaiellaceae bacterium]
MRRIVTLVIVLAISAPLSACGSSSSPPSTSTSTPPSSPRAELAAMRNAVRHQHSVHYVSTASTHGHKVRTVFDVGKGVGIQRTTVTTGHHTEHASVIVSGGSAYIKGDVFTMHDYFGFTKAQATKYAGRWISVPQSNPGYATVSADATLESFVANLFPQKKLSSVTAVNLVGVRGIMTQHGVTVHVTIFAPVRGQPLPVKKMVSSGHSLNGVVTMTGWNEALDVHAPSHAVPVANIVR